MLPDKICKTVHQYNKAPISDEDMRKLLEIASDYSMVKNYVYQRYSGIGSLSKLYPGYTVQNEMTESGLRERLGMPAVYFYLAIFDALGDIKSQWTRTKTVILQKVNQNENMTDEEKHFLRFLLKVSNAFDAALNHGEIKLQTDLQRQYDRLAAAVDVKKLKNYLCRQVRKHHVKMHTDQSEGFSLSERAYRYDDHGIYITMKEKRKRIFVPLTDNNQYRRQLYIKLFPAERKLEIKAPVDVTVRKHADYRGRVGLAVGLFTMFVMDEGHTYGERLGIYQIELADWVRDQTAKHNAQREQNPGRKKYEAKKRRMEEQLHSYINMELNRFLKMEKPEVIYIPKLPRIKANGSVKRINNTMTMWQRGYIKKRLIQKCLEQSVRIVEVLGKDISNECSQCGAFGNKKDGIFHCPVCGYQIPEKQNAAQNAKNRGAEGRSII